MEVYTKGSEKNLKSYVNLILKDLKNAIPEEHHVKIDAIFELHLTPSAKTKSKAGKKVRAKRNPSPYNNFIGATMKMLKDSIPNGKERMKECANKWSTLSDEEKNSWAKEAASDSEDGIATTAAASDATVPAAASKSVAAVPAVKKTEKKVVKTEKKQDVVSAVAAVVAVKVEKKEAHTAAVKVEK